MPSLKISITRMMIFIVIQLLLAHDLSADAQSKVEKNDNVAQTIEIKTLTVSPQVTEELINEKAMQWDLILVIFIGFSMMCSGAYLMKKRRVNIKE